MTGFSRIWGNYFREYFFKVNHLLSDPVRLELPRPIGKAWLTGEQSKRRILSL